MFVQLVLAADAERGLVLGRGPAEVDSSLEARVDLLVDGATKDLQKNRIESDPVKKKLANLQALLRRMDT